MRQTPAMRRRLALLFSLTVKTRKVSISSLALSLTCCAPSTGYQQFVSKSPRYYLQVADACDKLAAQASTDLASAHRLAGTDSSLPELVRDLHPDYVLIGTNGVGMRIGVGRGSYWIGWSSNPMDATLWELEASVEGSRRTVFSQRKFSASNRKLSDQ
jgi:hypothetical protein